MSLIKHFEILKTFSIISSIQTIIVYLYVFFLARYGTETDYANYIAITYIVDFAVAVGLFGFNLLILREPIDFLRRNLYAICTIALFIFISVYSIYFVFIMHLDLQSFIYGLALIILNYLYQIGFVVLVKFRKNKIAFLITILNFIFVFISLLIFTYCDIVTYTNVVIVRIIQVLIFVFIGFYSAIKLILPIQPFSLKQIKECFFKALPIGGGTVIGTISLYVDKFILSTLSVAEIARYSVARFDIPFIGIFINNLSLVYMSNIKTSVDAKDYEQVKSNLKMFMSYGWYFNMLLFTILFCNSPLIISLLYSDKFLSSDVLFKVILCSYLLKIVPYSNIIVALGIERIIITRMLIELCLQIVVSLILLHFFGILGLALGLVCVLLFWSVPYNLYYFAKTIHCKIIDFIPYKSMLIFTIKSFVPCVIVTYLLSSCTSNLYITLAVTISMLIILNLKEIKFIFRTTK